MIKKVFALLLVMGIAMTMYSASAFTPPSPQNIIGADYRMYFDKYSRSRTLVFPYAGGHDHIYDWRWAIRYGESLYYESSFNLLKSSSGDRSSQLWLLTNGDVRVELKVTARSPDWIEFSYTITPLKNLGTMTFYQGCDFDVDGTTSNHASSSTYNSYKAVEMWGPQTDVLFYSPTTVPSAWQVSNCVTMWNAINSGVLNNGASYVGDGGVALAFTVQGTTTIGINLVFRQAG